jgi:hypothetical protein
MSFQAIFSGPFLKSGVTKRKQLANVLASI